MMPVDGDQSAPVQASAGSSARARAVSQSSRSVTPFSAAFFWMRSSSASWSSLVATISLPQLLCAMPRLSAVVVEPPLALDAEPRLQAAGRVVDAGMDDLAVARAGLAADQLVTFQEDNLAPGLGQRPGRGQPDDAGADDDRFDPLRHPA